MARMSIFAAALAMISMPSAGCAMKSNAFPSPPGGSVEKLEAAPSSDLSAVLATYLHGQYDVESAEYFVVSADIPWNAVSKHVANEINSGAMPTRPTWHEAGLDLVDLYGDRDPPFAVAMSKTALADGHKLVGYFRLTKTAR